MQGRRFETATRTLNEGARRLVACARISFTTSVHGAARRIDEHRVGRRPKQRHRRLASRWSLCEMSAERAARPRRHPLFFQLLMTTPGPLLGTGRKNIFSSASGKMRAHVPPVRHEAGRQPEGPLEPHEGSHAAPGRLPPSGRGDAAQDWLRTATVTSSPASWIRSLPVRARLRKRTSSPAGMSGRGPQDRRARRLRARRPGRRGGRARRCRAGASRAHPRPRGRRCPCPTRSGRRSR